MLADWDVHRRYEAFRKAGQSKEAFEDALHLAYGDGVDDAFDHVQNVNGFLHAIARVWRWLLKPVA